MLSSIGEMRGIIMKNLSFRWKKAISWKGFWPFCFAGLLVLFAAIVVTGISGHFVDSKQGASLSDLILDHLPAINLDILTTWGFLFIILVFLVAIVIHQPEEIPFMFFSVAFFVFIRSGFISLTHLGAPADILKLSWENGILRHLSFTNDLFFSGHTGLPFLFFLIIKEKWLKSFFLIGSIVMAVSVLLTHTHYSIDVFAAFFISYSIFHIARYLFAKDYELF